MRSRCRNPNDARYPRYGGRGLTVCDRWDNSFEAFMRDVGLPPSDEHQLHRIDRGRGYHPDNCEWRTAKEKRRMRSDSTPLPTVRAIKTDLARDERGTIASVARRHNVAYSVAYQIATNRTFRDVKPI